MNIKNICVYEIPVIQLSMVSYVYCLYFNFLSIICIITYNVLQHIFPCNGKMSLYLFYFNSF